MGYEPGSAPRAYSSKEKKMNEQEIKYQKAKERVTVLRGFYRHLSVYVIVNLGLFLINMITSPETLWFIWPLMGWGIAIVLHALRVFVAAPGASWEEKKIAELMQKE
jgi:hypothetical protein